MSGVAPSRLRRAFTLIELRGVMGILVLLAVLTVAGVGRISKDARLSTAVNRITAALGNARAIAIKENAFVLVVFKPNWPTNADGSPANADAKQTTEIVIAKFTGESEIFYSGSAGNPNRINLTDRYLPVPGVAPVQLPSGIKVAGPNYEFEFDTTYESPGFYTQGDMKILSRSCGEYPEYYRTVGVLFGPDGRRLIRNPTGSGGDHKTFVDFDTIDSDNDGDRQDVQYRFPSGCNFSQTFDRYYFADHQRDETITMIVPFLMVYDDDAARELKVTSWTTRANIEQELVGRETGFIARNGQRIDFNPATGVVQP
ncbi:MAG: pilus assembly FimT family protein [Phycisphaerales bacterium]